MAAVAYRRGYGWSLPPITQRAEAPGDPQGYRQLYPSQIRIFSAKGLSAPGTLGTAPLPQIGTPIPGTNLVYIRPRLSQDELGGFDGSPFFGFLWPWQSDGWRGDRVGIGPQFRNIVYTNPEYSYYRENRRTPSIGMAGAGQMGATMDVPWQSQVGWFGLPASTPAP
jgi:hypothetical protein